MSQVRYLTKDQAVVSKRELERLHAKAKAHDAYLEAAKVMGPRQSAMIGYRSRGGAVREYATGYLAALREFDEAVVMAGNEGPLHEFKVRAQEPRL